jgi:TPR repeat protein
MKLIIAILFSIITFFSNAQRAEVLNIKSKELLNEEKFEKALPILIEAAELGNAESQYNLGVCYQFGYGTVQNDSVATSWYLKSAEQGWTDSEYKMSYAYIKGTGIEKNEQKAFVYTLKCATKKDVECIFNLISCYTDGIGTEKDSVQVLEWAVELAKMETSENLNVSGKITSARLNLAHMFMNGKGVNKDIVKSYTWFIIYNESKSDFSVRVQEQQIELIKKLEKQLSHEQIANAKTDAEKMLGKSLTNFDKLHQWNK